MLKKINAYISQIAFKILVSTYKQYRGELKSKFNRSCSFGDTLTDRWERAKFHNFGENTSCYDNVLILGDVSAGENCWIGPNVILDGTGGLEIGNFCHLSAGTQIYSHNTKNVVLSDGTEQKELKKTTIGNNCYFGPNVIIQCGVTIGDFVVIGANSFVNKDLPSHTKAHGCPAKILLTSAESAANHDH